MLAAVVCSTLCGFRGLSQLQQWLALHGVPMWHLLGFTRKPPKAQAFSNLLAQIDVGVLEAALLEFVDQLGLGTASPDDAASEIEIWDGKTLRGTRKADSPTQQLLVRMDHVLKRVISSDQIPRTRTNPRRPWTWCVACF
jgi:hypothetical protein